MVAVVVLVATYLTWLAARVDRLHARAVAAYATLDAHLLRRAVVAVSLAEAAQLPTLVYAARIAVDAQPEDREVAENDLTRHLRDAHEDAAVPEPELSGLVQVSRRVALARQVHNDVVRDALAVRRRLLVRLFRLARKHPRPAYFDVDDPSLS
ncbi:membrane protein [Dactylosporangium siamense]|uniref:Membrane protein n=1 Tax=Dactylosporangium siamense TaxID=685454 RepID=A0A919UF22_9ACTN|nr:membrane protein [Dactylosporangium siamense]